MRARLEQVINFIFIAACDYHEKGLSENLHTIPANECENDDHVHGRVTKRELKLVYTSQMVGKGKPARNIYDEILSQAPIGRCPFCGVGFASTLDHYLPKNSYPQLSVTPENLVPSCKDCNTGKGTSLATNANEQCLHPYFDHGNFISEQWLFAEIVDEKTLTARYFVHPPKYWTDTSKARVKSHFDSFKLALRYSIEAANEIASRKYYFDDVLYNNGLEVLIKILESEANSHARLHINSWQTALYQALASEKKKICAQLDDQLYEISRTTCQRCGGSGSIFKSNCDACYGMGSLSKVHSESLGEQLFAPIPCPNCIAGSPDCSLCKGVGKIPWEKTR
ncbi:hypothetical protein P9K14_001120 [Citrobacter freundii]|nr:hypothetical protein [Citrobacter freundii]